MQARSMMTGQAVLLRPRSDDAGGVATLRMMWLLLMLVGWLGGWMKGWIDGWTGWYMSASSMRAYCVLSKRIVWPAYPVVNKVKHRMLRFSHLFVLIPSYFETFSYIFPH